MQLLLNIVISIGVLLLAATSFSLTFRITRVFDFAHGFLFILAPYVAWMLNVEYRWSPIASLVFAFAACVVVSILLAQFNWRLQMAGHSHRERMLISLGSYIIVQNVVALLLGNDHRLLFNDTATSTIGLGTAYITGTQVILFLASLLTLVLLELFLRHTNHGRRIAALSSNEELSVILGINPWHVNLVAGVIGAVLAALFGILVGIDTGMDPHTGFRWLLWAFVIVIVAGVGSTRTLIVAAGLVASIQHATAYWLTTQWSDAILFALLIVFLLVRPLGFSGKRLRKVEL